MLPSSFDGQGQETLRRQSTLRQKTPRQKTLRQKTLLMPEEK
jgi:hypothetical protein